MPVAHRVFSFAEYTLDLTRGCLRRHSSEVALRPKSFDVLRYLIENAGRLVSKDELLGAIWPNVHVTEDSLTRCVSEVRLALRDDQQQLIKTLPRRGYLFAASVTEATAEELGVPLVPEVAGEPPAVEPALDPNAANAGVPFAVMRWRWAALGGIAVLLVALIGGLVWNWQQGPSRSERPSIAVLPFANSTGDSGQDYFSDGVTEDLITNLSKFSELFVIAQNSTFTYKNKPFDAQRIGRELGVRYLVTGSVRRDAGRLRITAQLIDSTSGHEIWAEQYDRELSSVFAVQDDVTRKIVVTLVAHVARTELDGALRKPPGNLVAYDYYLRANALMRNWHGATGQAIAAARAYYVQSIASDPNYAPAVQGLAYNYNATWLEPWDNQAIAGEYRQQSTLDRALTLAERAVSLDGNLAEAHATLGSVLFWQYRRSESVAEFERALELNPNLADQRYGLALIQSGHKAEGIAYIKRIMRLDPFHPDIYFTWLGYGYYLSGQYSEALEALRTAASRQPDDRPTHVWLAAAAARLGQSDEARRAAGVVLARDAGFTIARWLNLLRLDSPGDNNRIAEDLSNAGLPK